MLITTTGFSNLLLLQPRVFSDSRGRFMEVFSEAKFRVETGLNISFVQDNESVSSIDVIRGLHFQTPPKGQAKLVRVSKGSVLDVVVDLRKNEPTYGKHFKQILSAENAMQMFIPEGFAHGFHVLEDQTIFSYKCSNYYDPKCEQSLKWNDPTLNIQWDCENPIVSERDEQAPYFADFETPFF
jgi:dTDP-4-dehydrorhamnose 3,5-epimerase